MMFVALSFQAFPSKLSSKLSTIARSAAAAAALVSIHSHTHTHTYYGCIF